MNYLSIDFGGTYIKYGVINEKEKVVYFNKVKTFSHCGPNFVLARLLDIIFRMISDFDVLAVSIAVASPVDPEKGILYNPPNLPGFEVFDLGKYIRERVPVPVFIDNDANLYALGEYFKGAGEGSKVMVALTLGTGVGGGIVFDGNLWYGAHGFGGELGHITIDPSGPLCNCGNRGCLEALASSTFLIGFVKRRLAEGEASLLASFRDSLTGEVIYNKAKEGDFLAKEAFRRLGKNLGIGLASIANIFDPDVIVVGGGLSGSREFFAEEMMEEFNRRALLSTKDFCKIKFSELGDLSAIWGGYFRIIQNIRR